MYLHDEVGNILNRLYRPLGLQIGEEEIAARQAYRGVTIGTDEVQDHLDALCHSIPPPENSFQVRWLPQARDELEVIWLESNPPPYPDRHHAAWIRYIRDAVEVIDQKLLAWATLTSDWGDEAYVLYEKGFAVMFRVDSASKIVLVEHVEFRPRGMPGPELGNPGGTAC